MAKYLTRKEATQHQKESHERMERALEERRQQEAEEYRYKYQTTIVCAHRDNQDYIEAGDFDLMLCSDCMKALAERLHGKHGIEVKIKKGECDECGANLYAIESGRCGHCAFGGD